MIALSIRQPWAWLILNGKDVENRQWPTRFRGRFLIHASKGMTHDEYEDGLSLAAVINPDLVVAAPSFGAMQRGGIVGEVELVDCVTTMRSKWFFGRYGFVLRDAKPLPFVPYKGQLGFFEVRTDGDKSE